MRQFVFFEVFMIVTVSFKDKTKIQVKEQDLHTTLFQNTGNKDLSNLTLSINPISGVIHALQPVLKTNEPYKVTTLAINGIFAQVNFDVLKQLLTSAQPIPLKKLLFKMPIGGHDEIESRIIALSSIIEKNSTLEEIDIARTPLTKKDLSNLYRSLKKNKTLQTLKYEVIANNENNTLEIQNKINNILIQNTSAARARNHKALMRQLLSTNHQHADESKAARASNHEALMRQLLSTINRHVDESEITTPTNVEIDDTQEETTNTFITDKTHIINAIQQHCDKHLNSFFVKFLAFCGLQKDPTEKIKAFGFIIKALQNKDNHTLRDALEFDARQELATINEHRSRVKFFNSPTKSDLLVQKLLAEEQTQHTIKCVA